MATKEKKKSKKVKRINVLAHPCWPWYAEKILLEFFLILLCLLALDRDLLLTTRGSDPLLILHLLRITQNNCLKVSACECVQTLWASSPHWVGVVGLPAAEPKLHRIISCSHWDTLSHRSSHTHNDHLKGQHRTTSVSLGH